MGRIVRQGTVWNSFGLETGNIISSEYSHRVQKMEARMGVAEFGARPIVQSAKSKEQYDP